MVKCTSCYQEKPEEEFNWRIKGVRRHRKCRECTKILKSKHYINNRQQYLNKQKKINEQLRQSLKNYIAEYLKSHLCVDCGINDIRVLEFDHVNPADKKFNICEAIHRSVTLKQLKEEIEKCKVRCANCHRIRHYEERLRNFAQRIEMKG